MLAAEGDIDTTFSTGTGFDAAAYNLAVASGGDIYVLGAFFDFNGTPLGRFARLNADGSIDNGFSAGAFSSGDPRDVIALPDDGAIVTGQFRNYAGTSARRIVRLNSDGSINGTFVYGSGFDATVYNVDLYDASTLVLIGNFSDYNGTPSPKVAKIDLATGAADATFSANAGTGFDSYPFALAHQADGKLIVGGAFTDYNGTARNRIVRLNVDGSVDTSFDPGTGFDSNVDVVAVQPDGKIVAVGAFSVFDGSPAGRIVRLNADGSRDSSFTTGSGFDAEAGGFGSLQLLADGRIMVGGAFTTYDGASVSQLVRLEADGTLDATFDVGAGFNVSAAVNAIEVQGDGNVVAVGDFTTYRTSPVGRIVRIEALPAQGADVTAPNVSVTSPAEAATVAGSTVDLSAAASDNVGVAGVRFEVDGTTVGAEDVADPYVASWDSTGAAEGSHTVAAVARDAAGNYATSTVTVTVRNVSIAGVARPSVTTYRYAEVAATSSVAKPVVLSTPAAVSPLASHAAATATAPTFIRDLAVGATGDDVRALQIFLNSHRSTLATSGPGSAGHETSRFGLLTRAALLKFQVAHGISPAAGYFGPITRRAVEDIMAGEGGAR